MTRTKLRFLRNIFPLVTQGRHLTELAAAQRQAMAAIVAARDAQHQAETMLEEYRRRVMNFIQASNLRKPGRSSTITVTFSELLLHDSIAEPRMVNRLLKTPMKLLKSTCARENRKDYLLVPSLSRNSRESN